MSKLKEHYQYQIENSQFEDEFLDDEYFFQEWEKEQEYEKHLKEQADKADFERIFSLTNTYPF